MPAHLAPAPPQNDPRPQDRVPADSDPGTERPERQDVGTSRSRWRRLRGALWSLRFLPLQAAIVAAAVWVLLPLGNAMSLPQPSFPSYTPEPPDLQETLVLGATAFAPGAPGAVRVVVYDPRSGDPLPDVGVRVTLLLDNGPSAGTSGELELYTGHTDAYGTANVAFEIPEGVEGDGSLVLDTEGPVGTQRVIRPVVVHRDVDLSIATDKPSYRPGETIHLRTVALSRQNALPLAGGSIAFEVRDPRGDRICASTATVSAYGIADASCELADRLHTGAYRVSAGLDGRIAERTVAVERYALPGFRVALDLEQPFALPGERVAGRALVRDVLDRPLAGAQIVVSGAIQAPGATPAFEARGETDSEGAFPFSFDLSSDLLPHGGQGLGLSFMLLSAQVAAGEHGAGTAQAWLPISTQPILIEALPVNGLLNGGALKVGMENPIRLRTLYPDGRPAECALSLDAPGLEMAPGATDAFGQGDFSYWPPSTQAITLTVVATDVQGQEGRRQFAMAVDRDERQILLRPERPTYRPGAWMQLDAFVLGAGRSVYLDLIQDGHTVGAYATEVIDGRAHFEVQVPEGMAGALELQAYALLPDGVAIRDVRQVTVGPNRDLDVTVRADREQYAPGDRARLRWQVADAGGAPVQSILGILTVEEPLGAEPSGLRAMEAFREEWTLAATTPATDLNPQLAKVVSRPRPMPDRVKAQLDSVEAARAERSRAFVLQAQRLIWALAGGALLLWAVVTLTWYSDAKAHLTPSGIARAVLLGAGLLPLLLGASALLSYLGRRLFGPGAVVVLIGAWLGVLLALFVLGWTQQDRQAHLLLALAVGYVPLTWGVGYTLQEGGAIAPPSRLIGAASLGAALLALYALAVRWARRRAPAGTLASGTLIVLLLTTAFGMVSGPIGAQDAQAVDDAPLQTATPSPTPTPPLVAFAPPSPRPTPPLPVGPLPATGRTQAQVGKTVYWSSEVPSGPLGEVDVEIPLPDTVGAWHVYGHASTIAGSQGTAEARLRALPALTIRPELPTVLTMGDELDLPIWVDNALPVSQTVRVTATQASWYWLRKWGTDRQQLLVPPQDTGVLYLPIRVREWGEHVLELTVQSEAFGGTVSSPVYVYPNGERIVRNYSGWTDDRVSYKFRVPWNAVQNTERVTVKLYPGWASFLDEGLDGASRLEGDSFDEVAARARVNALWQRRLLRTGSLTPEREAQSARRAALDYQRLLSFLDPDEGFTALGAGSGDPYRSAYGVASLDEMAALYPVDPASADRAARWLLRNQAEGGTWRPEVVSATWTEGQTGSDVPRVDVPYTAYVAWTLIEAGYADTPGVRLAIQHLEHYLDETSDPYVLSLALHALLAYGERVGEPRVDLRPALTRLADMAQIEGGLATWDSGLETLCGAIGDSAEIERTALATHALLRGQAHPEVSVQGLATLAEHRDASGTWRSPQATFAALSAFSAALERVKEPGISSTAQITVDGIAGPSVALADRAGPVQIRSFDQLSKGYNDVEIQVSGDEAPYQIVGTYYLPWSYVLLPSPEEEDISIEVAYDRTVANVGEVITVTVGLMLNRPGVVPLVALELGLPPGLELLTSDWDRLLEEGVVAQYEQTAGLVKAYVAALSSEQAVSFRYRLRTRFPSAVQTMPSRAFDVANPARAAVREPVVIEIVTPE